MTTVSAKPLRKGKQKPPAPPSTVLTITLNPDRTGSLIVKRGDVAVISQFTYQDMKDILEAMQQGAGQLVAVEKDPPPKALSTSTQHDAAPPPEPEVDEPAASDDPAEVEGDDETPDEQADSSTPSTEADPLLDAALSTHSAEPIPPAALTGITGNSETAQLSLL